MHTDLNDDALMARIAQGQEAAFCLLVQRWEHDIHCFLVHMMHSVEEAEDLTQETFIKVYGEAGRYQGQDRFKSWLFRIAGNLARSKLRRRKILSWIKFDPQMHDKADVGPAPDLQLEGKETAAAINASLAQLPDRQREALILNRFHGMRYREIAETMGTTVPGVESLIQRATATLRDNLFREGG